MSVLSTHVETLDEIFARCEENKNNTAQLQNDLDEAEEALEEMKMEIHTVTNPQEKQQYNKKIDNYKQLIGKYKKQLLVGASSSSGEGGAIGGKNISKEERGQQSLDTLKQAHAQLIETDEVAVDTMNRLRQQRETIEKTKENTEVINASIDYAKKLVNKMGKWWR